MKGNLAAKPIVASLATLPERIGSLRDTVDSLLRWASQVNVFVNGAYGCLPYFLDDPRIVVHQNGTNIGDRGKFFWTKSTKCGYHFICDDDLLYSLRYAELMIEKIEKYQRKAIVGIHGSVLASAFDDYYSDDRKIYPFMANKREDHKVDFLGTGVMAFHAAEVDIPFEMFDKPNMADVFLGVHARRSNIPLICIRSPGSLVAKSRWPQQRSIFAHSMSDAADSCFNMRAHANRYLKSHWNGAS